MFEPNYNAIEFIARPQKVTSCQVVDSFDKTDRVYVAGAMTPFKDDPNDPWHFDAFNDAKAWLEQQFGCAVFNPATASPLGSTMTRRIYMSVDLNIISQCTGIFMLDGFEHAQGALLEHDFADYCSMKVMYAAQVRNCQGFDPASHGFGGSK